MNNAFYCIQIRRVNGETRMIHAAIHIAGGGLIGDGVSNGVEYIFTYITEAVVEVDQRLIHND